MNDLDYECSDSRQWNFTESHLETDYQDLGQIGCLHRGVTVERFSDSPTESGLPASPDLPSLLHIERYFNLDETETVHLRCAFAFQRGSDGIIENVEYTSQEELSAEFEDLSKIAENTKINHCIIWTKTTFGDGTSTSTIDEYSSYHPDVAWYSIAGETANTLRIEARLFPVIEERIPSLEEAIDMSAYIDFEELKIAP